MAKKQFSGVSQWTEANWKTETDFRIECGRTIIPRIRSASAIENLMKPREFFSLSEQAIV